jgi:CheY-specific phosphatase CheX
MQIRNYLLAAALGALGGGVVMAMATKAIPKMMSQMMAGMMQNMMRQMGEGGSDPAEM